MHIHSYEDSHFVNTATDYYGNKGSANDELWKVIEFEVFQKYVLIASLCSSVSSCHTIFPRIGCAIIYFM